MNKKEKRVKRLLVSLVIICVILFIFITYFSGISETIEHIIYYVIGGLTLIFLLGALSTKNPFSGILCVLGIVITFGLFIWSEHNGKIREEIADKKTQDYLDSLEAERIKEDSIQNVEDSIKIIEASKRLHALEGDTIFGNFLFGMSEKQCDIIRKKISSETDGYLSLLGQDFTINFCEFYHDQLYYIHLLSSKQWIRYYYYDANVYDDTEGLGDGSTLVKKIKDRLSHKYGLPNNNGNWHFTYKDIEVQSKKLHSSREGLLGKETWGVSLTFTNPKMKQLAQIEEKEIALKKKEEQKKAEEDYQRKKESFGGGL